MHSYNSYMQGHSIDASRKHTLPTHGDVFLVGVVVWCTKCDIDARFWIRVIENWKVEFFHVHTNTLLLKYRRTNNGQTTYTYI